MKRPARLKATSLVSLRASVADVAELDRIRSGYRLVFNDGSALVLRLRGDVRRAADAARSVHAAESIATQVAAATAAP